MYFVEDIRVGKERAEAGFGAKEDRLPVVGCAGIILRIGIAEDPTTQGNELFVFFRL